MRNRIGNRVVCFIPCCKSKCSEGRLTGSQDSRSWFTSRVSNRLRAATEAGSFNIEFDSPLTSAFDLYTGSPYRALRAVRTGLRDDIEAGHLITPIISAGYGLLDPREPIHNYNEEMKGRTATFWRFKNLVGLIAEALLEYQPNKVFGFFAAASDRSHSSSKYRYFYTEGVQKALAGGLKVTVAGCFYRLAGLGTPAILDGLGRTLVEGRANGFGEEYLQLIEREGREDGNVRFGFERFT